MLTYLLASGKAILRVATGFAFLYQNPPLDVSLISASKEPKPAVAKVKLYRPLGSLIHSLL